MTDQVTDNDEGEEVHTCYHCMEEVYSVDADGYCYQCADAAEAWASEQQRRDRAWHNGRLL